MVSPGHKYCRYYSLTPLMTEHGEDAGVSILWRREIIFILLVLKWFHIFCSRPLCALCLYLVLVAVRPWSGSVERWWGPAFLPPQGGLRSDLPSDPNPSSSGLKHENQPMNSWGRPCTHLKLMMLTDGTYMKLDASRWNVHETGCQQMECTWNWVLTDGMYMKLGASRWNVHETGC